MFHDMHAHKMPDLTASSEHFSAAEEEIYVPRPSCSKFCHVCRVAYDDYLSHTEMYYHHESIEKNKFSLDINKLCQKMGQHKTKPIRKNCKRNKANKAEPQCLLIQARN